MYIFSHLRPKLIAPRTFYVLKYNLRQKEPSRVWFTFTERIVNVNRKCKYISRVLRRVAVVHICTYRASNVEWRQEQRMNEWWRRKKNPLCCLQHEPWAFSTVWATSFEFICGKSKYTCFGAYKYLSHMCAVLCCVVCQRNVHEKRVDCLFTWADAHTLSHHTYFWFGIIFVFTFLSNFREQITMLCHMRQRSIHITHTQTHHIIPPKSKTIYNNIFRSKCSKHVCAMAQCTRSMAFWLSLKW